MITCTFRPLIPDACHSLCCCPCRPSCPSYCQASTASQWMHPLDLDLDPDLDPTLDMAHSLEQLVRPLDLDPHLAHSLSQQLRSLDLDLDYDPLPPHMHTCFV